MSAEGIVSLGITASGRLSCALRSKGHTISRSAKRGERSAGKLASFVAELLDEASIAASEVDEIRLDLGPGSYTGLRAAIAFAQMAAGFARTRICATTSSELLAIAALDAGLVHDGIELLTLRTGTRDRVLCTELCIDACVRIQSAPAAISTQDLLSRLRPGLCVIADSALHEGLSHACSEIGSELLHAPEYAALDLFSPRLTAVPSEAETLAPLYLMGSYAE